MLSHTANTPAFGAALRGVAADFSARDRAIDARFDGDVSNAGGGARTNAGGRGAGAGLMSFADAAAVLAGMADDYAGCDGDD